MSEFDGIVEEASVQYDHWKGSVALDNPDRFGLVEERLGIDRDRMWLLGFKITHSEEAHFVEAYVVDRAVVPNAEALEAFAEEHDGVIPVTRIEGTGLRVEEVLDLFKRWELVALARSEVLEPRHRLRVVVTDDHGHEFPIDDG